jgi:tRNA A-37 threonylcarbamoyl transferase component Bud32
MIAAGSRPSGLDVPFLEMEPVLHEMARAPDSYPDLGTLEPGTLIADRYRVLHKIAAGGMGVVYACEDCVLVRQVAVKLMQPSIAADPLLCERLLREARLAAQLRKHVAQVFDCGALATGEPYIVMELLQGRDLHTVLQEFGPLAPEQLTAYMLELCVGLAAAHEKGIIHRDLKPENLYCAQEPDGSTVLKILDFGVSKQLTSVGLRSHTNPTESVGSPQYMSPEQITKPSEVDPRTDIWSLGVAMFELLTGRVLFNGVGTAQVCAAVLTQPIPPFSAYRSDVPPALEAIVLRCLQRDRERRFRSVAELAAALSAFSTGNPASVSLSSAHSDDDVPRLLIPPTARRWLGALCAVAVLGACAAVLGLAVREGRIRLPTAQDVERLPAKVSAWRVPFLSPTPEPEPAPVPVEQRSPAASPNAALEERPLAPAAPAAPDNPLPPLANVQVRTPAHAAPTVAKPAATPATARPSEPSSPVSTAASATEEPVVSGSDSEPSSGNDGSQAQ